jgi:hypothetical protein
VILVRRSAGVPPTGSDALTIRRAYLRKRSRRRHLARMVTLSVILGAAAFWLLVAGFTAAFLGS